MIQCGGPLDPGKLLGRPVGGASFKPSPVALL